MGIVSTLKNLVSTEKRSVPTYKNWFNNTSLLNWFTAQSNSSGQAVTAETSLKLSAYYACVRNISEDIAKMSSYTLLVEGSSRKVVKTRATFLLNKRPSSLSTPFTFISTLVQNALRYGNGYAYIERDKDFNPIALYVLQSNTIQVEASERRLYYIVNDIKLGLYGTFSEDEIFHLRGMGDGYVGVSILGYAAESLGKALAAQAYSGSFFGSGATLTGAIKVPGPVQDEKTAKAIKKNFKDSFTEDTGAANGIALLANGAEFQKISVSPNEAQFIETQEFNVSDIARWFNMPLNKLQAGSTGSSNIEQLNIQYVTDCLMPWIKKIEQEVERKLFRDDEVELLDYCFDTTKLMRGDSTAVSNYFKTLYYIGAINPNEVRNELGMNPIPDGDKYFSPVNMIPTDQVEEFWSGKSGADNQATTKQGDSTGG